MKDIKCQHKANDPYRQASESERSRGYGAEDRPQQKNYRTGAAAVFVHDGDGRGIVQPPRCLVESHLATQNSRVYSPHAMSEPEYGPSTGSGAYKLVPIQDNDGQRHFSDSEGAPAPAFRSMMMSHEYSPPSPAPEDPMIDCERLDLDTDPAMHRSRLIAACICMSHRK